MLTEILIGAGGTIAAQIAATIYRSLSRIGRLEFRTRAIFNDELHRSTTESIDKELIKNFARAGQLTEGVERALRQILELNLMPHFVNAAIIGETPHQAIELVQLLNIFQRPDVDEKFPHLFWEMVKLQVEVTGTSKAFEKRKIEASFRSAESQTARILKVMEEQGVSESLIYENPIERIGDYESFMMRVADDTRLTLDEVDVHGARGEITKASLDKIFVPCPIHRIHSTQVSTFRDRLLANDIYFGAAVKGWAGILELGKNVVLLGDPGGGKSTHTKMLCCQVAERAVEDRSYMPLFIHLRTYAALKQKMDIHLFDYIIKHVINLCHGLTEEEVRHHVLYNLGVGRAIIVFDGLDEVLSEGNRLEISREISHFSKRFFLSRVIVTSRYVGYEVAPLDAFVHAGIGALDIDSMADLYRNVSIYNLGMDENTTKAKCGNFLRVATSKARDLVGNPLLLTLIIIVENQKREIPDNRAALYEICADLLFDIWDSFRKITPDLPERFRLWDLLTFLAAKLYEDEEYGGRLNRNALLELTKGFFIKDYIDNKEGKAAEAARKFVDHLTGRAWVLHEVGENLFEFTHRTFMEFFYARHLVGKYEVTEELLEAVKPSILRGERTVPAHLAFQMRSKDNRTVSSKLARGLNNWIEGTVTHNSVEFAAEASGYLVPPVPELDALASTVTSAAVKLRQEIAMVSLFANEGPLREVLRTRVAKSFGDLRLVPELAEFTRLLDDIAVSISVPGSDAKDLRSVLETSIESKFRKYERSSPFVAKVLFDLGFTVSSDVLAIHGLRFWANNHANKAPDYRLRDGILMLSSLAAGKVNKRLVDGRYAELAVAVSQSIATTNLPLRIPRYRYARLIDDVDITATKLMDLPDDGLWAAATCYMMLTEALRGGPGISSLSLDLDDKSLLQALSDRISLKPEAELFENWLDQKLALFDDGVIYSRHL